MARVPVPVDELFALAARQHGLFTRPQAYELGFSDRRLRSLRSHGIIAWSSELVMRVTGSPETWERRVLEAVLGSGSDECMATGRTAARLEKFDSMRHDDTIELLTSERLRWYQPAGVIMHRTSIIDPSDQTTVGPIRVTDPVRTWLILAASLPPERLEDVLDAAERDGLIRRDELLARLARLRRSGRDGVGVAARLLEAREAAGRAPHTVIERKFVRLLESWGIRLGVNQHRVVRSDGVIA